MSQLPRRRNSPALPYRLVCKGWKGFFDDPSFWQLRMKRRGNYDSRWQLVDLYDYGLTLEILNKVHPPIHVSQEWYCASWDCGTMFWITVALIDDEFKLIETHKYSEELAQWEGLGEDLGWRKVMHTFQDYKAGVRYVLFVDGGKDTQFWAGHYGSKMAAANVHVEFTQ